MKRLAPYLKSNWPLLLILVLFSGLTLYQSVVLPLGEADDETDHYQYLRFVARTGHPPLTAVERGEAGFKGGLAPLYYWLAAWPVALVGEGTPPDIRRVDSRPERYIPTDGLGFNHVLHTLDEQWPWRGQPLAWHLIRWLSLPLAWVTIVATYALARRLVPDSRLPALTAAAFVALLPRFVISSAVINDDNLVFALAALLLLVQVIIVQQARPPTRPQMALLGGLFGLALVTKYFSLILLPEVLLTLWFALRKSKDEPARFRLAGPLLAFLLALLLTAGLWFGFILLRFNRVSELGWVPGLAASLGEPQITEGLVGLLSGQTVRPPAATYPLPQWLGLLYRSFWFEYGWMNVFAPAWLYWFFSGFALLALIGLIHKIAIHRAGPTPSRETGATAAITPPIMGLLGLHLALFVVVVLARYVLSATIDTGQGRHLYPALPVIALLLAGGIIEVAVLVCRSHRPARLALCTLLPASLFLAPALVSLWPAHLGDAFGSRFVTGQYHTHPVTGNPVTPPQALNLDFAPGLSLAGYQIEPAAVTDRALPVTLYWHAKTEATRDYLLELCLTGSDDSTPVACWRGHFEDGRYPARAWEASDTLIDTVYLPLPVCKRRAEQTYRLALKLWSLEATTPRPLPEATVLSTQLPAKIQLRPPEPPRRQTQPAELWLGKQRLAAPIRLGLGQSLAWLSGVAPPAGSEPTFNSAVSQPWQPAFSTALQRPCNDDTAPAAAVAQFIVDATRPAGLYRAAGQPELPPIEVQVRQRRFAPVTSTLTFSQTLAPLVLSAGGQTVVPGPKPAATIVTRPGATLPVTIRWQARRWMADPLVIALKLLDKDFAVGGQRIATLGDRYPNVLWVPTEIVAETYPLQLDDAAPPGLYRLELGIIRQDKRLTAGYENLPAVDGRGAVGQNLYPLAVRVLDPAHDHPPAHSIEAQLGDSIRLTGFEVNPVKPDSPDSVSLALYWQSSQKIGTDYTVFTQLIGPDGQVWAQWDNPPQAGRYPTSAWSEHDTVVDRYTLTRREGAPPGQYRLLVGMYNPTSGSRLPALVNGQPLPDNAIELTKISFEP